MAESIENLSNKMQSSRLQDTKREDYLKWEEYFMSLACISAMRSKDPNTQVGAAIVNKDKKVVGLGYNGMPIGCPDDEMPWGKFGDNISQTKYGYVCHAEMNAIMNKNILDISGSTIYATHFPCNECAKLIIQARISEVVYQHFKQPQNPMYIASTKLFDTAGVTYRKFQPEKSSIHIQLKN